MVVGQTNTMTDYTSQSSYQVRFEWGLEGLRALAGDDPVVIVVDVLSFSTAVSVALSRRATVFPFRWRDERATEYAQTRGALLAGARDSVSSAYSLSPASLQQLAPGSRLVLPSPNGSALCFAARCSTVMTGCLRNRTATAATASSYGRPIAVIAAGERWPDGSLRPALEDLLGAGAIIAQLTGARSPEAQLAASAFSATADLAATLRECSSGVELSRRAHTQDVLIAAELDADAHACVLTDGAFTPVDG